MTQCPECGAEINDGSWTVGGKYLCGSYEKQSDRCLIASLKRKLAGATQERDKAWAACTFANKAIAGWMICGRMDDSCYAVQSTLADVRREAEALQQIGAE